MPCLSASRSPGRDRSIPASETAPGTPLSQRAAAAWHDRDATGAGVGQNIRQREDALIDFKAIFLLQRFFVVARDELTSRRQPQGQWRPRHRPASQREQNYADVGQRSIHVLHVCGEKLFTRLPLGLEYELGRGCLRVIAVQFGGQLGAQVCTSPPKRRKYMGVAVEFAGERRAGLVRTSWHLQLRRLPTRRSLCASLVLCSRVDEAARLADPLTVPGVNDYHSGPNITCLRNSSRSGRLPMFRQRCLHASPIASSQSIPRVQHEPSAWRHSCTLRFRFG